MNEKNKIFFVCPEKKHLPPEISEGRCMFSDRTGKTVYLKLSESSFFSASKIWVTELSAADSMVRA